MAGRQLTKEELQELANSPESLQNIMLVDEQWEKAGIPSLYTAEDNKANAAYRRDNLLDFENVEPGKLIDLGARVRAECDKNLEP